MTTAVSFNDKLRACVAKNQSWICVGLDPDPKRLPAGFAATPAGILKFNRAIIQATSDLVCAYKPNLAFYEIMGDGGWKTLARTIRAIPSHIPVILDAKRGDIGNTAAMYARALFDELGGDAVTVNPLLGSDSLEPFFAHEGKGVFVLCLTSNRGAREFQIKNKLHLQIARRCRAWAKVNPNVGLVVGATHPRSLRELRALCPRQMFLVPGVGAQGGDMEKTVRAGTGARELQLIINASRSVIHAASDRRFAEAARREAQSLREAVSRVILR